jgi:hypothetical protein
MDHVDKAKVRSAVGLTVDAGWFMDVVNAIGDCSDGDPDRCTYPTRLIDLGYVGYVKRSWYLLPGR